MDLTNAQWRKSQRSASNGGNCIELAALPWRKSTRSGSNGGDCVELSGVPGAVVAVRDSKDPDGPVLLVTGTALRAAVQAAAPATR
ncbi:DUF397 domain-containing protein [Actinomadura welshii]